MVTMKMNGGHAHHDHAGHGDEHGDEHGVCHDAATHENHAEYETEETCEAAGHMWVEEDGHGDNHGDYCHDATTHENHDEYETEDACEDAGHVWMEGDHDDSPTPEEALAMADANNDSQLSWDEFWTTWNTEEDHDDHGDDDHDGHDEEHHGLAVLFPNNSSMDFETDHDDLPENASGWNLTTTAFMANNVAYTYEDSQFGAYLVGVNGTEAPEWGTVSDDESWYWSVYVWNETGDAWDMSSVGLSSIVMDDTSHVALAASNANLSMIPTVDDDHGDDDHSALEEAMDDYMMGIVMTAFNDSDANNDTFLTLDELTTFIPSIDDMGDALDAFPTDLLFSVFDEDEDGGLSLSEFMEMMEGMEGMEGMEEDGHDGHDDHDAHEEENNVAVLYPDNTSALFDNHQHSMDSGWNLTMDTMEENNIALDYSVHPDYGTMLTGINGIIAPADSSWWWSLYLWNETSEAWETSPVGIDSVVIGEDSEHIAWAASNADMTLIPDPEDHGDDDNGGMTEAEMMEFMFNMFDTNSDGMINASELEESMNMGDDDVHDDHDGHGDKLVGHAVLEVLAEGDYGFAMPANIEFFIVMAEGGHDDHDDHGDEDGDDHGDEGEHSDEEEGEALSFDPHSWLDFVVFKE
jgi:Ca2+-binding EF-hand superfamily protein